MTVQFRPISDTDETVTLRRAEYDASLDQLEEARDLVVIRTDHAHEVELGYANARKNYLSADESRRLLDGELRRIAEVLGTGIDWLVPATRFEG
ncbi:MAG TPA: hypothetical protein VLI93_07690 [Acetobacteraceae bacterium]|nr:hypothetical protein [Acetobacteraceae bacterium]